MFAVPTMMPVTSPVPGTGIDTVASVLLHVPPNGVLPRLITSFTHTTDGPLITDGSAFTVTAAVR